MKTLKTRFAAVILAFALIFTLAAPLSAAVNTWAAGGWLTALSVGSGGSTATSLRILESSGWLRVAAGSESSLAAVTSYASIKQSDLDGGGKRIIWKDIDAKIENLAGFMDLNSLITKSTAKSPVVLLFTSAEGNDRATSTSLETSSDTSLFYFEVPPLQPKFKLSKPEYKTNADGSPVASVTSVTEIPSGLELEITRAEDYNNWQPLSAALPLPVYSYKTDYWVRIKATETTNVSANVKLSIGASPAAPAVKVDVAKGKVPVKRGQHVILTGADGDGNDKEAVFDLTDNTIKAFLVGETYGGVTITERSTFIISTNATASKPASAATTVQLGDYGKSAVKDASVDDFILRVKDVTVIGSVPYEMYSNGKWSKIKAIKLDKFPEAGIKVRIAGNGAQFAGSSITIKLDKQTGLLSQAAA
ncbi:hypothetical protein FACS18949_04070 [Clostridia bacterium]|nr:hypothetical protein FACS18949_04070 [Clostridia bacterium]